MVSTGLRRSLRWSVEAYHQLVDAGFLTGQRVELIDGEILEMVPERADHTYMWGALVERLRRWLGDRALVRPPAPITLSESEPEPDVAVVRGTWEDYRDRHPGVDDIFLLVEVSRSTLRFDRSTKAALYGSEGIAEYWIVDLQNQCLAVYRNPQADGYGDHQVLTAGAIAPLAFEDCVIQVESLFQA